MSMDETFRELQLFRTVLENFNRELQKSMNDLENSHNNVSPHWQDEMRKTYDAVWVPLQETMNNYINREAPAYEHFLDEKIEAVRRYLHG